MEMQALPEVEALLRIDMIEAIAHNEANGGDATHQEHYPPAIDPET